MIVGNPCNPDYRVIKEAEALAEIGHEVRVFCAAKEGVPDFATVNGVTYQRLALSRSRKPRIVKMDEPAPAVRLAAPEIGSLPEGTKAPVLIRLRERSKTELRRAYRLARSLWRLKPNPVPALRKRLQKFTKFELAARVFAPEVARFWPDVVHAHDLFCLPAGLVAARAAGARLVYDSHELEIHRNPPLPPLQKLFCGWVEGRAIRRADAVITVCEPIADHLRDAYRIARPAVLFNAPSLTPRAEATKPTRTSIRSDAKAPEGKTLAVYVGLVTVNRGIETLLEALVGLPEMFVVAVGPKNVKYVPTLMDLAKRLGVEDRFALLAPVPPEQVVDYISGADIGLNPLIPITLSYQFAMPNKLFEMAFAGLPIVNSDARESAKFVRDHALGIIYPSGDADACRNAMITVAANLQAFRPSADKLAALRDAYGWHRQAEKLGALYERILAPTPIRQPVALSPAWPVKA